jgi:hypothetical protein
MDNILKSQRTPDPRWELYAGDALPGDSIMLNNDAYMITAVNENTNRIFNISLTLRDLNVTAWQRSQGIGIKTESFRPKDILVRTEPLDYV